MDYQHFFEHLVSVKKIRWSGNQGIGRCPLPDHDDRNPSFSFNVETGQNFCHSCGWKGNAYTLAKTLNMDDPHQFIDTANIDLNNYRNVEYKLINTVNNHSEGIDGIENMDKYEELKERYSNRINLGDNYKDKY